MAGEVERKLRIIFRRLDVDQNGVVTKKDFLLMAERFCDLENADPVKRERMIAAFTELYLKFTKFGGTAGEELLTESALAESLWKQKNDPDLWKKIENLIRIVLVVLRTKEDGYLQYEEYNRIFANLSIPDTTDFTKKAFDILDSNNDGKLSFDEFTSAYHDYFFSEDENSPYANILGSV